MAKKLFRKQKLEIWPNPNPERDYEINISFPEFTCLCPRSGYPDFATIKVMYIPAKKDRRIEGAEALSEFIPRQAYFPRGGYKHDLWRTAKGAETEISPSHR